jgi:hypothetical protein
MGRTTAFIFSNLFCNDLYREAYKRKIQIDAIEVECTGDFGAEGEPASNFQYKAKVTSNASPQEIEDLINHTDQVAEVNNTLRKGLGITLAK